jgi:hypothetical protein
LQTELQYVEFIIALTLDLLGKVAKEFGILCLHLSGNYQPNVLCSYHIYDVTLNNYKTLFFPLERSGKLQGSSQCSISTRESLFIY